MTTWHDHEKVDEYLGRIGRIEARAAGERVLADLLPADPRRVLDLGCGDGRLAAVVLDARPGVEEVVAVDRSEAMLAAARSRFAADRRVEVVAGDLGDPVDRWGTFDVVVTGFAIHHIEDVRKRALYAEAASSLSPTGVLANLEVIPCATPELQAAFYERIGRPGGDPEDRLAPVDAQLVWLRDAGLADVDCLWRWWGFALLVGWAP